MSGPLYNVSSVPLQGAYVARRCPVRAQLDHDQLAPRHRRLRPSLAEQSRIDSGNAFEAHIFNAIADSHPNAVQVSNDSKGTAQASTEDALSSDRSVILGGYLPDDTEMRRTGKPDVLVRQSGKWVPVDVKDHRITESGGKGPVLTSKLDGALDPSRSREASDRQFRRGPLKGDTLQLAHYWRMLEHHWLAGPRPWGGIIDRDEQIWWIDLEEQLWKPWWSDQKVSTLALYDHEFAFRLDVIAHTQARNNDRSLGRKVVPVWTSQCSSCPWRAVCHEELEAADHVSLLPRTTYDNFVWHRRLGTTTRVGVARLDPLTATIISGDKPGGVKVDVDAIVESTRHSALSAPLEEILGRKETAKARFADAGIATVGDLARLDRATIRYSHAKVGHLPTLIDEARAVTSGGAWRKRGVSTVEVPTADVEVDIDMESSADGVYLWGALVHGDELPNGYYPHVSWDSLTPRSEAELFAEFWNWLQAIRSRAECSGQTFAAYYYSNAENKEIRRILRSGLPSLPDPVEVESFIKSDRWVDLQEVFTSQIVTGRSSGLKEVAPLAGFRWHDDDPGGEQSTVWYDHAVNDPDPEVRKKYRQRLTTYNRDDVRATFELRYWLFLEACYLRPIEEWTPNPGRPSKHFDPEPWVRLLRAQEDWLAAVWVYEVVDSIIDSTNHDYDEEQRHEMAAGLDHTLAAAFGSNEIWVLGREALDDINRHDRGWREPELPLPNHGVVVSDTPFRYSAWHDPIDAWAWGWGISEDGHPYTDAVGLVREGDVFVPDWYARTNPDDENWTLEDRPGYFEDELFGLVYETWITMSESKVAGTRYERDGYVIWSLK